MKTIDKLRELTKIALKNKENKILEKCIIGQIISKAHTRAREGGNCCEFSVPSECDIIYIAEYFCNEEFRVKTNKQMITIFW